jgi:hypothetical protein
MDELSESDEQEPVDALDKVLGSALDDALKAVPCE